MLSSMFYTLAIHHSFRRYRFEKVGGTLKISPSKKSGGQNIPFKKKSGGRIHSSVPLPLESHPRLCHT